MSPSEIDLLESVLDETEATIASVTPGQEHLPTPCPEFDVARIVDHLVGWANSFAARLSGRSVTADPNDYRVGGNSATEFHQAAQTIIGAYREGGEQSQKLPLGFITMEFLVHGWDLATAIGSSVRFQPAAADLALVTGRTMLQPEYRGPGKSFGYEVEVPDAAGPVDRLVAFLGRDPGWHGPPG
jgi:uncharacterized protein (TIGR03086 family)